MGTILAALAWPCGAAAQATAAPQQQLPVVREQVEVVATRVPEAPHDVPAGIEIVSGDDLRARGATNLHEALALSTGVEISPGSDSGPAGSVPAFLGLREFDAFLLVVDGIPWGGAFNPALTMLSLHDVQRIEILRGPAPITYGATSFVGVIHVVHNPAAIRTTYATVSGGQYGSGSAAVDFAMPQAGSWQSRLTVDGQRQGFADDRTSFARGHALYRGAKTGNDRQLWMMADVNVLNQKPASPSPRQGATFSPLVPIDANANPADAFINDRRVTAAFGMERPSFAGSRWNVSGSFSHSAQSLFRGFLDDLEAAPGEDNALGLRENIDLTDIYADTHWIRLATSHLQLIGGADFLHGMGDAKGADFDYHAPFDGSTATSVAEPTVLDLGSEDRREFFGGYALAEWTPTSKVRVSGGLRLNVTFEERGENETEAQKANEKDKGVTHVRPGGSLGAIVTAWQDGPDHVNVFANYRDTFKPAAIDFGLGEADAGEAAEAVSLLEPETARNYEAGVKIRTAHGLLDIDAEAFLMNFENLVTAATVGGLPALINTGKQRFKGFEIAGDVQLAQHVAGRATYSYHDARFTEFSQEFDGVLTDLAGKQLEMSPHQLFSAGVVVAPESGVVASATLNYMGERFLDKRNRVLAPGFATVDVGGGYRFSRYELRVDGRNLGNRRDPVSESELGDAQYYRMTARRVDVTLGVRFK
jgi:iron complex outermembrane receptor protein